MNVPPRGQGLLAELETIMSNVKERRGALRHVADAIQQFGNYRWVGLYAVDRSAGLVRNLVWSGPGGPAHPTFPLERGLTGAAIGSRQTVNVGDVAADSRYLTTFGSTQSEIIIPVFDLTGSSVVGTIDIESEQRDAFSAEIAALLEGCAERIRPLWSS
jgi:L-methionine (R)-S-oxide reductase